MDTVRGGRRGGGIAHVFLAVALALPVGLAVTGFVVAATAAGQSGLNVVLLGLLGVVFVVAVGWAALLPGVRQVEVVTARTLLGADLPDVGAPGSWPSRRRGAAWLGVLVGVGSVVGAALLFVVPLGIGLVAQPFSDQLTVDLPAGLGRISSAGTGTRVGLVVVGVLLLVAAAAGVLVAARPLRHWAPSLLGPSAADRARLAEARGHDLARRNELAREVHDSLGHSLTAMTLQAGAARRLLRTDPDRAERALAAVEDLGRRAQADVDAVVGTLRGRPRDTVGGSEDLRRTLAPLLDRSPVAVELAAPPRVLVDGAQAQVVYRTVQEALTNAARHGTGSATVRLDPGPDALEIVVENPVDPARTSSPPGRRGLLGVRERLVLVGGEVSVRTEAGTWILTARLPR